MLCNVGLADSVLSFNSRIVFIGGSFTLQRYDCRRRITPRGLSFALQKLGHACNDFSAPQEAVS
jgi:hypothetical protein